MKTKATLFTVSLILLNSLYGKSQIIEKISANVTLSVNTNIETYFIAEKLAVEHIGNYVFSNKAVNFSHQPIVYFGQKHFASWTDSKTILRISDILRQLRDVQYDNSQQLEYLLYRKPFPEKGFRWPLPKQLPSLDSVRYPGAYKLTTELSDSLASFYVKAKVGDFLKQHKTFYKGALAEAKKYINVKAIPEMEKWYGQHFAGYEIYLMPGMPITPGEDNYRAFGPMLYSPKGQVSAMVFSSSIQLPLKGSLDEYLQFGFDNRQVTKFLTVHEIGHSFVNPLLANYKSDIARDTALFTKKLAKRLENSYIGSWETCLIEHLVRLGEIRIARSMGDVNEEARLRKMHVEEFGFVLLPLLEKQITIYENDRRKYPNFNSYLPELFTFLHGLTPAQVDDLLK